MKSVITTIAALALGLGAVYMFMYHDSNATKVSTLVPHVVEGGDRQDSSCCSKFKNIGMLNLGDPFSPTEILGDCDRSATPADCGVSCVTNMLTDQGCEACCVVKEELGMLSGSLFACQYNCGKRFSCEFPPSDVVVENPVCAEMGSCAHLADDMVCRSDNGVCTCMTDVKEFLEKFIEAEN